MINLRKTFNETHAILASQGVTHALIGGFALAVYGHQRATADIDFLADGTKVNVIKESMMKSGYQLRFESSEVLQFFGPGFVDIILANRPLSQEMLRQAIANKELDVFVLRPEDLIGLKIQAYKNDHKREHQDKADIQSLLKLPNLDFKLIKKYAELFNEWTEIEKLKGRSQ